MRITRNICGCDDCRNLTGYSPEGDALPCCQYCDDSPCEYLVLWECLIYYPGKILGYPIHALRRECPFGDADETCIWTGHRGQNQGPAFPDDPLGQWAVCDHVDANGWHWWPASGQLKFPGRYLDGSGAHWALPTFGCRAYGLNDPRDCWWHSTVNNLDPLNTALIEWVLVITSATTATLTGYPTGFSPIVYTCDDFDCTGRSTFEMTGYPNTDFPAFPPKVCVVPGYTEFINPCNNTTSFCNCCDNGEDTGTLTISIDCGNGATPYNVTVTRNAPLPGGVSDPGGACGYFWGTFTHCGKSWGLLTYCDGTDWKVQEWCLENSPVKYCDTTATLTRCCPGAQYTWTCSGDCGDCQCESGVGIPCCDHVFPTTLYATLSAAIPAACPDVDGDVVTLTYVGTEGSGSGLIYVWRGDFDGGACGTLTFEFNILNDVPCEYSMCIRKADTTVCWGDCSEGLAPIALDCDLSPGVSATYTWSAACMECCGAGLTATVSA